VTLPSRSVCLYVDGAQNPAQLERGIGRYVSEHTRALQALAPSLLHSILVNPKLSLTDNLSSFFGTGLLSSSPGSCTAEGHTAGPPGVYHIMSPFEAETPIDVMWPVWARDPAIATVVTVYDLIPLIFPDQYLTDTKLRAFYSGRVELLRHVDGILAISQHTAEDAIERLGVSPERVHVIHAGTNEHFAAMYPSSTEAWAHLSRHLPAVRPGFLLYVGGADFRKNTEGMIAGFARLPAALRAKHQLVIAGILNPGQGEFLRGEAAREGLRAEQLVLTDHVSDADLGALYHACHLFVFPSLYEGFGLPILEAMACGAPVAASASTSVPEVLGGLEGTFDPHDPDSIAWSLAEILTSEEQLEWLRVRSKRQVAEFTWTHVAEQSIVAYERTVARHGRARARRTRRARRARLALVTPWPPEQTRLADYNRQLAVELGERVDVDVIVAHPVDQYPDPPERVVQLFQARDLGWRRDLCQYDRVLYCIGNGELHGYVYKLLMRRSGAVVLHDVLPADFYQSRARAQRPEELDRGPKELDRALANVEQCLVLSGSARDALDRDRGPFDPRVEISVIPFGMPPAVDAPRPDAGSAPLIVSFGDVDEVSGMSTLIDAFALLSDEEPAARLVITGRAGPQVSAHAARAPVEFLGLVGPERYGELLRTADLAVQLRLLADDQAPTLVADCLANGIPTVVTDLGWAGDLPPDAAEKVPGDVSPDVLRDRIMELLGDSGRRAALSRGALAHARACSFARVAEAYLDALGLA
jgi:glycosyltransferase involved in cell wall biosynthesis